LAVDRTVEDLMERLLLVSSKRRRSKEFRYLVLAGGSPSCAIVTHDVEELAGRDFCSTLMDLNDSAGSNLRSRSSLKKDIRFPKVSWTRYGREDLKSTFMT